MIITLTGADFSSSNIGTLSTWSVTTSLGTGATYSGVRYVDKGAALNATVTLASGYEVGSAGVTVTMGGVTQSSAATVSGSTITIAIASVTGNFVIKVPTVNTATGEEGGSSTGGGTLISSGSCAGAYLYENYKFNDATMGSYTNIVPDTTNVYFVYDKISVTPEYSINIPQGRACYFSKSDGTVITGTSQVNLSKQNYTTTVPATAAYITVCFKYEDIQPANVTMTMTPIVSWGTPTTILLKDSGATYMDETAIEKNKTEPSAYTGYFTYHLIPVTGGNKYKMENCRLSIWYDSNKQFIGQVNFNVNSANATTSDWSHVAPSNAAYLSVCVNKSDSVTKDTVAMVEYPAV